MRPFCLRLPTFLHRELPCTFVQVSTLSGALSKVSGMPGRNNLKWQEVAEAPLAESPGEEQWPRGLAQPRGHWVRTSASAGL